MLENANIKRLLEEAWAKRGEGKYDDARNLVKEAHRLSKENDYNTLGRIYHVYMQFESDHDNYSKAMELSQKSLSYYKQAKNLEHIAHATRHIADLQYQLGKDAESEQNYRAAIGIYRDNPNTHVGNLANALRGFGLLLEQQGRIEEAIDIWKETKDLYASINLQEGVAEANKQLNSLS